MAQDWASTAPRTNALSPAAALQVVARPALLALAYYVAAQFGFELTFQSRPISVFWTPNAIVLGALLLTPARQWWHLLLAVLPAHMLVELQADIPVPMALLWYISNSSEALIGAWLVRRYIAGPFCLDRFSYVSVFVWRAVVIGTVLSSVLDAAFVALYGWGSRTFWEVFQVRVFANTLTTAVVVPFMLAWGNGGAAALKRMSTVRALEAGLLIAGLALVGVLVFALQRAGSQSSPSLLYAPLPLLLWAAVRFGVRGQSTALLVVVIFSMWSAGVGRGPFVTTSPDQNAFTIQLLFLAVAITLISLAAVLEERTHAQSVAHQRGEQLQLAMDAARMNPWQLHIANGSSQLAAPRSDNQLAEWVAAIEGQGEIHPADITQVRGAINQSSEEGTPLKTEFRVVKPDGTVRWLSGQGKVLLDDAGRPARMVGLTADITERKSAETLTAGENRVLELIASGAPLADTLTALVTFIEAETNGLLGSILLLDEDGTHMRHGAAPSLPEDFVKAVDGIAIGPRTGSCGTAMYTRERVIVTDIAQDPLWDDFRELALSNNLRACWSTPIISDQERVLGSFAMYYNQPRAPSPQEIRLIDIATQLAAIAIERKRVDSEVHEQRRALAHLARVAMLGELSGALAHELAQPLTAVLSNAQAAQRLLARDPPDLDQIREILLAIVAADRRASDVIHRLRPMLTKGQVQLAPLQLNDVVFDTLRLARSDLAAREVSVTTRLNTELPPVLGDRVQLQQVMLNLIINACDAMKDIRPADRYLSIVGRRSRDNESVEVSLTDSGTGIPAHLIDRIFDPFYSSKEHGLGLGLSICRSIAVAHRGLLKAVNNPEGGATFSLTLPIPNGDEAQND